MSFELKGKKVFVSGGSRGIGAGIVRWLAGQGVQVAFSYSSRQEAAESVLGSLPGEGHFHVAMNLSDEASINSAMSQVFERMGSLDGLVNNAGITRDQLLLRMKNEDFDEVIQTNLRGQYLVTKSCIKPMVKARQGSIVFITSVIGHTGNAGQANYAASKGGIEAFSRSVALELASRGIRSNTVAPGFIETEMTEVLSPEVKKGILEKVPLASMGSPEDVAGAVGFLLSPLSKYVTGHCLHVNGGLYM